MACSLLPRAMAEGQVFSEGLHTESARSLHESWRKVRGYDVQDLQKKEHFPEALKPGLVVDHAHISDYSWLKTYLPTPLYRALAKEGGYLRSIRIVPTVSYSLHRGVLEQTQNMQKAAQLPVIDGDGVLRNVDGTPTLLDNKTASAIPYLHPKNGMELLWSFLAHGVGADTLLMEDNKVESCSPQGDVDYSYQAHIWWQKYHGRRLVDPLPEMPGEEGVVEAGSVFVLAPYDVRGFAGVRKRFAEADESDDFRAFIPAARRARRLSGNDAQDPMWAGLEITWDDWRSYWVKPDPHSFDYKLRGETWILAVPETGLVDRPIRRDQSGCVIEQMDLELRPVWVLEITDKTGRYQYGKRTLWIDREFYYTQYETMTDPRGELWRTWTDARAWNPETGEMQWRQVFVSNEINGRTNFMEMNPVWEDRGERVTDEQFDIDQLRDYQ